MTDTIDIVAPVLTPEPEQITQPEVAPEEKQVTMSQSQLDALIKSRQAAALKKAAALEKQVELLKTQVVGGSQDASEVERLRAEISAKTMENDRIREESIAARKTTFITQQAQKQGFLDADVIVKLTRDNLKWDDAAKGFADVPAYRTATG